MAVVGTRNIDSLIKKERMQEEELKKLNDYDYRSAKPETSIGIRNVITRIKLYYGGKGKVRFLSRKEGTTVEITIPAERRD